MKMLAAALLFAAVPAAAGPWDGTWVLDVARSSAGAKDGAADAYRFTVDGDAITWEIPSLGEVVTGRIDGSPMAIHRSLPTPGLTLAVTRDGPYGLRYAVARDGNGQGGGMMHLIEGGKAWVDVSWAAGQELGGAELIYVKRP